MKMAKTDKADFNAMWDFFNALSNEFDYSGGLEDEALGKLVREKWGQHGAGAGASWRRVVMGCEVLIDSACDPAADTLEFKPDIVKAVEEQDKVTTLRPVDDWHDDVGDVLWWYPGEPPYCGSPLDTDWPGYHEYFTLLPEVDLAKAENNPDCKTCGDTHLTPSGQECPECSVIAHITAGELDVVLVEGAGKESHE